MVSTSAKTCPHCGVRDPTGAQARASAIGCAGILAVIAIIAVAIGFSNDNTQRTTNDNQSLNDTIERLHALQEQSPQAAAPADQAAPKVPGVVSIGERGKFVLPSSGCPTLEDMDQLTKDAVVHDSVGFVQHFAEFGCINVRLGETGLNLDYNSFYGANKIRLDRNERVYWITTQNQEKGTEIWKPITAPEDATPAASNQTADWYYNDDNEGDAECHALSGTPKQFADAAVRRGATNLDTTGNDILGADVVISYDLKDKSYSYSFYKSHEKCANPLGAADNTKPDFSRISHDVDTDQDKTNRALDDAALKHATDKGPWWVSDGAKIWGGCKLSKFTPMGDALSAKAKGARNIEIEGGLGFANVSHPTDVVVEYDLNGKSFFNDYYTNKFCDDSDPPSQTDKAKAISVSSRHGESWYVDYYSGKMQCVETKRAPKELADEAKRHGATDIEFAVPSSDDEKILKTFLYLQYGVGDQGHEIGFYKTRDACTGAINN
jgi:hypothetical protein